MNKYTLLNDNNASIYDNSGLNILNCLYPVVNNIPILIRDLICQECQWSIPTFYLKMGFNRKNEMIITNAEKERILEIISYVLTSQAEQIKSIQRKCFFL
jgi:hypothetical protein